MEKKEDIHRSIPPASGFICHKRFSDLDFEELQFALVNNLKIEDDLQEINAHVKTCAACRGRLDSYADKEMAMRDYYRTHQDLFAEATAEALRETSDKVAVHLNRPGLTWRKR